MKDYIYQNNLIGKKQLRQLLAWSFTNYDSMQSCFLADKLKYLGFKYATEAGISINIEDLKIPFVKNLMLEKATKEIINAEKIYLKGKITDIERFQKIINTWNLTSESLKDQIIYYFKNYDPLNSVYIMASSGARGNLSQVRQLVGMRGLMSDPNGEIMKLPIKKNFREGLTITDYLMSGYGARKGIVDTALKTANSGYLTRRLIDVSQDILIREKDCLTTHSFLLSIHINDLKKNNLVYDQILGRVLNKSIIDLKSKMILTKINTQITSDLIKEFKNQQIKKFYVCSPLTCNLYRAICQKCYGWDLANENLVDIGEAIGILAGQSIGEPGTQLTMRTFHTGGIFTSEAREQITSPVNGIIKCHKALKTLTLRTNRGEDVFVTKNSGSLIIISDDNKQSLVEIKVLKNTIIFPKNNQYILKDTVIGELINLNKQIKTEIQPILSDKCGEIFMPRLKKKINVLNSNKLIWILSGQLYNSPTRSFINFYSDHKLNKYSYIFRTKIINHYSGYIEFCNKKLSLYERIIQVKNDVCVLSNSKLQKLKLDPYQEGYLLNLKNLKYHIKIKIKNLKSYLQITRNKQFGNLITNSFRTLTGGIIYYDYRDLIKSNRENQYILYFDRKLRVRNSQKRRFRKKESRKEKYLSYVVHRTIIWLGEEIHEIKCDSSTLFVEHGDFIAEGFEIVPKIFSKTSGIVVIDNKNSLIHTISIKAGFLYVGQKLKPIAKKLYYPGETLLSNITIKDLSFCEHILEKQTEQLLIRPVKIYEFSLSHLFKVNSKNITNSDLGFKLEPKATYIYKPNQIINGNENLNLVSIFLKFKANRVLKTDTYIELKNNKKINSINFHIGEKLHLNNYIAPYLKYKNLQSSFLTQKIQFIDHYVILGYLESITINSLEIVKFKIKKHKNKQILLISNTDCLTIQKDRFPNKKLNDFILNSSNVNEIGKVIIQNKNLLTIQKGKPYFFPNCRSNTSATEINLQYKLLSPTRVLQGFKSNRSISLNYYDVLKFSLKRTYDFSCSPEKTTVSMKSKFSKLFIKKNGKFYSSLIPEFFKKFSIGDKNLNSKVKRFYRPKNSEDVVYEDLTQTLLLKSSEITNNNYKQKENSNYQLTLVKFIGNPLLRTTKAIGIYSVTEDYFEIDTNSVFCKNTAFIEEGETIGLLNLEKEITGDIVQGLPRIEEILEARKKNLILKRIPTSKKKGLLAQKTSLDPNFEFRKIGNSIKENDKINPHKLLKVYFNYYGLTKSFLCDTNQTVKYNRLINNYEGSYKSFKKVQSFILDSVQSVYKSQGVTINSKHLEVIIKQMTTKVLITYEGNTPLLRKEIIDLYHIQYINQVIKMQGKNPAYYVPLLLGITKAALNNPSFISAASFQETTRVLTKAAIEGRIDWLRGLKENIIIGHLIPAGTGSQNYRNCFKNYLPSKNFNKIKPDAIDQKIKKLDKPHNV